MNRAFAALSDPTRARIVDALADQDRTAGDIVSLFQVSQPSISRHLRVLREAGLVSVRPDGQHRVYRLNPGPLREIDVWLNRYRRFFAGRLDALERHLDGDSDGESDKESTE
jgi:DNA-binding transcriptional ArsR family regulator